MANVKLVLVANKLDAQEKRQVTPRQGAQVYIVHCIIMLCVCVYLFVCVCVCVCLCVCICLHLFVYVC